MKLLFKSITNKEALFLYNHDKIQTLIEQKVQAEDVSEELTKEAELLASVEEVLSVFPHKSDQLYLVLLESLPDDDQQNWETYKNNFLNVLDQQFRALCSPEEKSLLEENAEGREIDHSYDNTLSDIEKVEFDDQLEILGLESKTVVELYQIVIDAGIILPSESAFLSGTVDKKLLEALNVYSESVQQAEDVESLFDESIENLKTVDIENFSIDEPKFDASVFYNESGELKDSAKKTDIRTQTKVLNRDSQLFQAEVSYFGQQFQDLQAAQNSAYPQADESTLSKVKSFGVSLCKTVFSAPALIMDMAGVFNGKQKKQLQQKHSDLLNLMRNQQENIIKKRETLAKNSQTLNTVGDDFIDRNNERKQSYLDAYRERQINVGNQSELNTQKKLALKNKQSQLNDFIIQLNDKKSNLNNEISVFNQKSEDEQNKKNKISVTIEAIQSALKGIPKASVQAQQMNEVLHVLQSTQQKKSDLSISYEAAATRLLHATEFITDKSDAAQTKIGEIGLANIALGKIDESLESLALQNGTDFEQCLGYFGQEEESLSMLDLGVETAVSDIENRNQFAVHEFDQLQDEVSSFNVTMPNFWEQSVGGVMSGVSEGLAWATDNVFTFVPKKIAQFGQYLESSDNAIISSFGSEIDFMGDVATGLIEGVSGMVQGTASMIAKPVQALEGMGMLIGRNPETGTFSLDTAGKTWEMFGKTMIGMDEEGNWGKEGDRGKALGQAIANIGSLFVGGSGAMNAAKTSVVSKTSLAGKSGALMWSAPKAFVGKTVANIPRTLGRGVKNVARTGKNIVQFPKTVLRKSRKPFMYYDGKLQQVSKEINKLSKKRTHFDEINKQYVAKSRLNLYGKTRVDLQRIDSLIDMTGNSPKLNWSAVKKAKLSGKEQKILLKELAYQQKSKKLSILQTKYNNKITNLSTKKPLLATRHLRTKVEKLQILDEYGKLKADYKGVNKVKEIFDSSDKLTYEAKKIINRRAKKIVNKQAREKIINKNMNKKKQQNALLDLIPENEKAQLIKQLEKDVHIYKKEQVFYTKNQAKIAELLKSSPTVVLGEVALELKAIQSLPKEKIVDCLKKLRELRRQKLTDAQKQTVKVLRKKIREEFGIIPTKSMSLRAWKQTKLEWMNDVVSKPGKFAKSVATKIQNTWSKVPGIKLVAGDLLKGALYGVSFRLVKTVMPLLLKNETCMNFVKIQAILKKNLTPNQQDVFYKNLIQSIDDHYEDIDDYEDFIK